jgi:cytochrome c oxidase subunit II
MSVDTHKRALIGAAGALALSSAAAFVFAGPTQRVIKIVAKKFVFVPAEIRVQRGETVLLQLSAPEVPMGFNLPDFALRADVVPGKVTTLQLTPDKAGSFTFLCDVFCGSGHEEMSGTLIVA